MQNTNITTNNYYKSVENTKKSMISQDFQLVPWSKSRHSTSPGGGGATFFAEYVSNNIYGAPVTTWEPNANENTKY